MFLIFSGCKTTGLETEYSAKAPELSSEKTRFIFIRLYDPVYKNPFYAASFLKAGISSTEVSPLKLSHASMNLSLEDNFYALTNAKERYDFKFEKCTDITTNGYMNKCNPDKSSQTTYAIAVSEEEYEKAKKILNLLMDRDVDTKYIAWQAIQMSGCAIRRKFFTNYEDRSLDYFTTPGGYETCDIDFESKQITRKFICSNLVAFVLQMSVYEIQDYFLENHINYKYIAITDLAVLPGVHKLFSSSWTDYNQAAEKFVSENPEFEAYFDAKDCS